MNTNKLLFEIIDHGKTHRRETHLTGIIGITLIHNCNMVITEEIRFQSGSINRERWQYY